MLTQLAPGKPLAKVWPQPVLPGQAERVANDPDFEDEGLPAPEAAQLRVPPASSAALAHSGWVILLVEDDVLAAQAIGDLFESLQLPFAIAGDARAALGLSGKACVRIRRRRAAAGPDVGSGTLAIELQKRLAMPCLLMTGETGPEIKASAKANGRPLLIKPLRPPGFARRTRTPMPRASAGRALLSTVKCY